MLNKLILNITLFVLRRSKLSDVHKNTLMSAILKNIQAIPIRDIIKFDTEGTMLINGRKLQPDQLISFVESCHGLKSSHARRLINEQLTYQAIKMGVYQATNTEQIMFAKAALWVIQEENALLASIVGE